MNRHERDDLLQFLVPLMRTRATDKDLAAETLIREHCARQPDALYLLVQRATALESALAQAQARIGQLPATAQADPGSHGTPSQTHLAPDQAGDRPGSWTRGLLAQAGAVGIGVGLGVTAGVVAGGLLLDAFEDGWSEDA